MQTKESFSIQKMYTSILSDLEYQLQKKAKFGEIPNSLPDMLMDKIRHLMENPELIEMEEKQPQNQTQETIQSQIATVKPTTKVQEIKKQIENIYEEQEEDDFDFILKCQKQKSQMTMINFQKSQAVFGDEIKQQSKIQHQTKLQRCSQLTRYSQHQKCKLKLKLKEQEEVVHDYILQYQLEQEQRQLQLGHLRDLSQASIYGVVNNNLLKKYIKPKGKDLIILLNLTEIFVKQHFFPYNEFFYCVRGLVTLKPITKPLETILKQLQGNQK